jgi:hypothetical protein
MSLLHVQHEFNYRTSIAFPYDLKDINWNFDKSLKISIIGFLSGFIAGIIGIGGGVVLGPILLSLGIQTTTLFSFRVKGILPPL